MIEILTSLLLLLGAFLILAGAIGVARVSDYFSRVHTASVPSTVGVATVLLGSALYLSVELGQVFLKPVIALIVLFLTVPLSTEMLARAAYITNVKPAVNYVRDDAEARHMEHKEAVE
ncbi:MAG: monovalent cation/H(+) antiporter subunit G [Limnochordales bacterium]|nr:monovalent cation/H(+) antiporter subunit G [Limnochordales bacterium]